MSKVITIIEAARRLGLTGQTLRNWIKEGHISVKKVGRARYLNEDTILALQDTVDDIQRQKASLEDMRNALVREKEYLHGEYSESADRRRYLSLIAGAALRSGFYENVIHLMMVADMLSSREGYLLIDYLRGENLEDVGMRYSLSRERVRQIIEKAIRKSRDMHEIEETFKKLRTLDGEVALLKEHNAELTERLKAYEDVPEEDDVDDETKRLLATNIRDCALSTRTINCLIAGRTDRRFSFSKVKETEIVPPCNTIGDVCRLTKKQFLKLHNAGKKTFIEVDDFLHSHGLDWREE